MTTIKIPKNFRPGGYLKPCTLGVDLPAWFIDGIQSLDNKIYPIYQPYEVLYEDIMTNYEGDPDDPRYTIHTTTEHGQTEIWGYPLKLRKNELKPNNNWHLWRLCSIGWAHIIELKSKDLDYLKLVLDELYFIAQITERYGPGAQATYLREKAKNNQQKEMQDNSQLFKDTMKENKGIMKKVIENYSMGNIKATNPKVESIMSYSNQSNKSRIIRPLDDTDKASGLILPDRFLN